MNTTQQEINPKVSVTVVSDLHNRYKQLTLPDSDLLVICGDTTALGRFKEVLALNKWLGKIKDKFDQILLIAGNHDYFFENRSNLEISKYLTNAKYLCNDFFEYKGKCIWGSPYTPIFLRWAFMMDDKKLKRNWKQMPEELDLLITHGPAYGVLDRAQGKHLGDPHLYEAIQLKKPRYHVCGHIHEGYGIETVANTIHVNASVLDGDYRLVNEPIRIEI